MRCSSGNVRGTPSRRTRLAFFEKKIRPILTAHCYQCHSAESPKLCAACCGWTRTMTSSKGASPRGDRARQIPIRACSSRQCVTPTDELKMPKKQKLPDEVIADFETWVKMGAPTRAVDGARPFATKSTSRKAASSGLSSIAAEGAHPDGEGRNLAAHRRRPLCSRWPRSEEPAVVYRTRIAAPCCAASTSTSLACRRRRKKSTPFSRTHPRPPSRRLLTDCLLHRGSANAGGGTGWTWLVTRNRAANSRTSPIPTPGAIAITSSPRVQCR